LPEPLEGSIHQAADITVDEESGMVTLELMLWSEDASLVIRAASIQILPAT